MLLIVSSSVCQWGAERMGDQRRRLNIATFVTIRDLQEKGVMSAADNETSIKNVC